MDDEATSETPIVEGRTIVTAETVERPASERPAHDSINGIADWMIGSARRITSGAAAIDELSWRLYAAGLPLLRVSLHVGTLHPQYLGAAIIWWRDTGRTVRIMLKHEIRDLIPYEVNPVRRVREGGETLRRRLDGPEAQFDFAVLHELKERGATDYLALPVGGVYGPSSYMVTYVSDRPGGFSEGEVADLKRISELLSALVDMHNQKHIAENILIAYLGSQTGPRAQARAIANHGGEILKFIGDGLLAIFPLAAFEGVADAARNAMAAAHEALAAVHAIEHESLGSESLKMVVALHYGTVIYGNIGAASRLDFTVIGPSVNLVSRIEAVAKSLDLPLVVSDDFARAHGGGLRSLGLHKLRGLDQTHELFVPAADDHS